MKPSVLKRDLCPELSGLLEKWERREKRRRHEMKTIPAALAIVFAAIPAARAATILNSGVEPVIVTVTEGADRTEFEVAPEERLDFCAAGCFVTLPNGDRHVLQGTETLKLQDGGATVQ